MPEQSFSPEDSKPVKENHHYLWIALAIICVASIAVYYLLSKSAANRKANQKPPPRSVPIETDVVHKGEVKIYVRALGTVIPIHSVTAVSQVQGQIISVNFKEGQLVKKGDSLVKIDPRPFEAAVLEAEGQLEKDTSLMKQAQNNLARYKKAYQSRAIAEQLFNDQQQLVQQTKAMVKTDQGALANAKVNLAYCDVTSPIDGQVGLRLIDPGNLVQANGASQLAVITQMEPITVIFSVAEDYLSQIQTQLRQQIAMPVEVFDRTQQKKIATGNFLALDNQIDPSTGTVRVRAIFDNKDHALFPNQFVNAKLLVNTKENALLIPSVAIQIGPKGPFVYKIQENNTAKVQNIKVDTVDGDNTSVEGLQAGDTIATNGFDKLQDGMSVTVRHKKDQDATRRTPITRN